MGASNYHFSTDYEEGYGEDYEEGYGEDNNYDYSDEGNILSANGTNYPDAGNLTLKATAFIFY